MALSRWDSQNVVATIEPSGTPERTLCVMAHIDSSRSGLIFHPRLVGLLGRWITLNSVLVLAAAGEPLLGRSVGGRRVLDSVRTALAGSLALLLERELLGEDVPGANDNASGCAVALSLAARIAAEPLDSTRLVLLVTGCEESGTLGASAFLKAHDTRDWLFLNFDNVGGRGTLRYLTREGVIRHWDADAGLIDVAERVARRRLDLRMDSEHSPAGLTYDASPVLARGGRALTLSIQDGSIENLHRPTDTTANVDADGVARTLAAGAEMIDAIDSGEAD
jgi:putative aminopeptidase FrvX